MLKLNFYITKKKNFYVSDIFLFKKARLYLDFFCYLFKTKKKLINIVFN